MKDYVKCVSKSGGIVIVGEVIGHIEDKVIVRQEDGVISHVSPAFFDIQWNDAKG